MPRSSLRLFLWLRWGVPGNLKPQRSSSNELFHKQSHRGQARVPVASSSDIRTMRKTSLPTRVGEGTVSHQYVLGPSDAAWQKEPCPLPPRSGQQAWPCRQPHRMLLLHAVIERRPSRQSPWRTTTVTRKCTVSILNLVPIRRPVHRSSEPHISSTPAVTLDSTSHLKWSLVSMDLHERLLLFQFHKYHEISWETDHLQFPLGLVILQ